MKVITGAMVVPFAYAATKFLGLPIGGPATGRHAHRSRLGFAWPQLRRVRLEGMKAAKAMHSRMSTATSRQIKYSP